PPPASAARRRSRLAWPRTRRSRPCCPGSAGTVPSSWPPSACSSTAGIAWALRTSGRALGQRGLHLVHRLPAGAKPDRGHAQLAGRLAVDLRVVHEDAFGGGEPEALE